jgi:CubicO group peptidase (beta-lactamase class C family)
MKDEITKRVKQAISDKVFPGCVIGVINKNGERKIFPFGKFTYDADSTLVKEDTIYDVASVTKAIPLASVLLSLIDRKQVDLHDPISKHIPEFGLGGGKDKVLIWHLLTYTLDLDVPSMASLKIKTPEEIKEVILRAPLKSLPGDRHLYTNSTAYLIGLLINNVTGRNLDDLSNELFFKPLGMTRTTFHPETFSKNEVVPTEFDEWRGRLIHGEVHDESSFVVNKKFILGMAGLFSTAPDLLKFMEMLLNDGELNHKRYFSNTMMEAIHTNQLASINESAGLGWELNKPDYMGKYAAEIFGKTGFTGCVVLCNQAKGTAMTLLSNRIYPKRGSYLPIYEVRRDIADIIFEDK